MNRRSSPSKAFAIPVRPLCCSRIQLRRWFSNKKLGVWSGHGWFSAPDVRATAQTMPVACHKWPSPAQGARRWAGQEDMDIFCCWENIDMRKALGMVWLQTLVGRIQGHFSWVVLRSVSTITLQIAASRDVCVCIQYIHILIFTHMYGCQ